MSLIFFLGWAPVLADKDAWNRNLRYTTSVKTNSGPDDIPPASNAKFGHVSCLPSVPIIGNARLRAKPPAIDRPNEIPGGGGSIQRTSAPALDDLRRGDSDKKASA